MLPETLKSTLRKLLEEKTGEPVDLAGVSPVGGGCINESLRVETTAGLFFVKYNDATRYPGMFEAEARGLALLHDGVQYAGSAGDVRRFESAPGEGRGQEYRGSNPSPILVPAVVAWGGDDRYSLLVLEYLDTGSIKEGFWEAFGSGLARLHLNAGTEFGLDHSNYIGSLPQSNRSHSNWIGFFISERIEAQLKLARDNGKGDKGLAKGFQDLYPHLGDFFPEESPALLHGDLWSGNFMVAKSGKPAIVDPAVYYGHRYMDLGMTKLFGGFAPGFYEGYQAEYPLEKDWEKGIGIANLYPLLVHLNLFGGGYLGSITNTLKPFRRA